MYDFEKLDVYKKAKEYNRLISGLLKSKKLDKDERSQLKRASFSIMLNIAEGSGRFTKPDKRNFYIIARDSAFECVAIFNYLKNEAIISHKEFTSFYNSLEGISKMLYALIKGLS